MNLLNKQLAAGKIYMGLPQYIRKVDKARNDIIAMLSRCEKNYVALSWGKQSIVLAHQVYSVSEDIPCVHWTGPDAQLIADFNSVRDQFLSRWGIKYLEFSEGPMGDLMGAIDKFVYKYKMQGVFLGLSAYESKGRKHTLRKNDSDNIYAYASGMFRCCPLADWTAHDLAAYITSHDLPLLSTYHRYGLDARTSVGVTPGSHAERGIDLLKSENQAKIRNRWRLMETKL